MINFGRQQLPVISSEATITMETHLFTLIPPAIIIAVIFVTNNLTNIRMDGFSTSLNNRIDDLRSQMQREHDVLGKKVDEMNSILLKHVTDLSLHASAALPKSIPDKDIE